MPKEAASRKGLRGGSPPSQCPADIIREIKAGNDTTAKLYGRLVKSYSHRTIAGHMTKLHDAGAVEYVSRNGNLNCICYRLKKETGESTDES